MALALPRLLISVATLQQLFELGMVGETVPDRWCHMFELNSVGLNKIS